MKSNGPQVPKSILELRRQLSLISGKRPEKQFSSHIPVEDVAQISSSEAEKLVEEASAGRGIVEYEDFINIIRQADGSCTNRIVVPALRHHLPPDYRAGRVEAEALLALRQSSQQSQSTVFDETWNSGFTVSTIHSSSDV
eukprot:tig00021464_g21732.t1